MQKCDTGKIFRWSLRKCPSSSSPRRRLASWGAQGQVRTALVLEKCSKLSSAFNLWLAHSNVSKIAFIFTNQIPDTQVLIVSGLWSHLSEFAFGLALGHTVLSHYILRTEYLEHMAKHSRRKVTTDKHWWHQNRFPQISTGGMLVGLLLVTSY